MDLVMMWKIHKRFAKIMMREGDGIKIYGMLYHVVLQDVIIYSDKTLGITEHCYNPSYVLWISV